MLETLGGDILFKGLNCSSLYRSKRSNDGDSVMNKAIVTNIKLL